VIGLREVSLTAILRMHKKEGLNEKIMRKRKHAPLKKEEGKT